MQISMQSMRCYVENNITWQIMANVEYKVM